MVGRSVDMQGNLKFYLTDSVSLFSYIGHTYKRYSCAIKDTSDIQSWFFEGLAPSEPFIVVCSFFLGGFFFFM